MNTLKLTTNELLQWHKRLVCAFSEDDVFFAAGLLNETLDFKITNGRQPNYMGADDWVELIRKIIISREA
tara:strand:+ start:179 stop:388 length:210 start_codon:yes stop_codon:yes gene_type:complete